MVTVAAPSDDELAEAIDARRRRVGVRFEPGLVSQIVADVHDQPGALPLLQYALTELFAARTSDLLTLEGYHATGGVVGALGRRAEELHARLDATAQRACRQVFLRLVSVDPTGQDTRRRVRRRELRGLELEPDVLDAILARYGEHRLLSFDREPRDADADGRGRPRGHPRPVGPAAELDRRAARGPLAPPAARGGRGRVARRRARPRLPAARGPPRPVRGMGGLDGPDPDHRRAGVPRRGACRGRCGGAPAGTQAARDPGRLRRARRGSLVLAAFALVLRGQARDDARLEKARQLAASAKANLELDPELSILLALQSAETTRSHDGTVLPETEQALHDALYASRVLAAVPGVGRTTGNGHVADLAPDGASFVAADTGSPTASLRDARTGERLATLAGHSQPVLAVGYSPKGDVVATGVRRRHRAAVERRDRQAAAHAARTQGRRARDEVRCRRRPPRHARHRSGGAGLGRAKRAGAATARRGAPPNEHPGRLVGGRRVRR